MNDTTPRPYPPRDPSRQTPEQYAATLAMLADFKADPDIQDIVKRVEAKPETTQGHYGDYLGYLNMSGDPGIRTIFARALIDLGADVRGVSGALRVLNS